jgi:hypothetical protein
VTCLGSSRNDRTWISAGRLGLATGGKVIRKARANRKRSTSVTSSTAKAVVGVVDVIVVIGVRRHDL